VSGPYDASVNHYLPEDCAGCHLSALEGELRSYRASLHPEMAQQIQELRAKVAELEAENRNFVDRLSAYIIERGIASAALVKLEAENERLKTALVAIQSTAPGSAHRIAIQALAE